MKPRSHFRSVLTGSLFASVIALGLFAPATEAGAVTFNFSNISGGDTVGDSLSGFLSVDVTKVDDSHVLFKFNNLSGNTAATSFIGTVYIDDNGSLSTPITVNVSNVGTVSFSKDTNPKNFPQGNDLNPDFDTTYSFNADNGSGNSDAIQRGESLGVKFAAIFGNVIGGLNSGAIRVGYHLQGITLPSAGVSGASDSYVNVTTAVPLPAALPLMIGGLAGLGYLGSRRRKRA
jgi:hypothetical protein